MLSIRSRVVVIIVVDSISERGLAVIIVILNLLKLIVLNRYAAADLARRPLIILTSVLFNLKTDEPLHWEDPFINLI